MMFIKKYIILLIVFLHFNACQKVLDKEPLDYISSAAVWDDPDLIDAYIAQLYHEASTRRLFAGDYYQGGSDPHKEPHKEPAHLVNMCDESRCGYSWAESFLDINIRGITRETTIEKYWNYELIRSCNEFFKFIVDGNAGTEFKIQRTAEVKFIRAFTYFEMVKRYGGVPLITVAQSLNDPEEELFAPRNTEKEIYDFILNECDTIISLFESMQSPKFEKGRIDIYTTLALKSRAALYAASIAKYGNVELNGVVGIPSNDADNYWQIAYDASKKIIDSKEYELYNRYEDKAENYQNIFLDESDNNKEVIFSRQFVSNDYGHSFDYYSAPISFRGVGWGSMINPTLNLINAFEMRDGSDGIIDWENETRSLNEIFNEKDPRLSASILFNGSSWSGDSIETWSAIEVDYENDGIIDTVLNRSNRQFTDTLSPVHNTYNQIGKDLDHSDATKTGFYIKKFLKPNYIITGKWESDQDWIEFRLAEILLNFAEAAFELGHTDDALDAVNQIRDRAGITELNSINIEKMRNERHTELVFECHRYWDLRRWRKSMEILNDDFYGLKTIMVIPGITYKYDTFNCDGYTRYFDEKMYYIPLGEDLINNNPFLIENPGYI